jgi:spoIIIJ-associated protein
MRMVEVAAKTREEAIQRALKDLGAERHEVEVDIVDEGSRGLFGFGARDVVIKVTAEHLPDLNPTPEPEAKSKANDGGGRDRDRGRGGRSRRSNREDRPKREGRPAREDRPARESRGRSGRERREGGENKAVGNQRPARESRPQQTAAPKPERKESPAVSEARGKEAAAMLAEVIRQMGIEAKVTSGLVDGDTLVLTVESSDSALLIGRKGRNLEAMQYLINRIMNTGEPGDDSERFVIDVEGYLERRRASLEELAQRMAERAKETGKKVRLKPLAAHERRVIHVTLQEDAEVSTYSVGSSSARTVVIEPSNGQSGGGEGNRERSSDRERSRPRRRRRSRRPRREGAEASATSGSAATGSEGTDAPASQEGAATSSEGNGGEAASDS